MTKHISNPPPVAQKPPYPQQKVKREANMKNADLPAMPQTNGDNLCMMSGMPKPLHAGLTKREMFAMNAPDAPSWFKSHLHKSDLLYRQAENGAPEDGGSYLFFAWRTYYADKILAQLERTK